MKNLKKVAMKKIKQLESEEFHTTLELFTAQIFGEVQGRLAKKRVARPKNAKPRSLNAAAEEARNPFSAPRDEPLRE